MLAVLRRRVPPGFVVALVIVPTLAYLAYRYVENESRRELDAILRTLVTTRKTGVDAWIAGGRARAAALASSPACVAAAGRPGGASDDSAFAASRRLTAGFLAPAAFPDLLGYDLADRDGRVIASSDSSRLGHIVEGPRGALEDTASRGERVFAPVPAGDVPGGGDPNGLALAFYAPVAGPGENRRATLSLYVSPRGQFSALFDRDRFSLPGATFAFDREGRMVSAGRPAGSRNRGRDTEGDSAAGRDPERIGMVVPGYRERARVAFAIDLDGRPSYRGTRVVSASVWDERLGLGVASEIDRAVAYHTPAFARRALTLLTVSFLVVLAVTIRLGRRSRQVERLIESAPLGMLLVDTSARVRRANPAAAELFLRAPGEVVGLPLEALVPAPHRARHAQLVDQFFAKRSTRFMGMSSGVRGLRSDGSEIDLDIALAPITIDAERCVLAMLWDISDRLRVERTLLETAAELARSNRDLEQFAYVASHDLRAPLRGIAQLAEWIGEDLGPGLSEDTRRHLDLVRGRVRRMDGLLLSLLDYARVSRGGRAEEVVDVNHLVREIVELQEWPSGFRVDVPAPLPRISTDRTGLHQVLLNLLGNARKHHDRPTGCVRVTCRRQPAGYEFLVCDDGPGIPEGLRAKAFEMFQTLRPRDEVEGSGMGLALVQRLVESRGGTVVIEHAEPRGTCIRFTWPETTEKELDR